jgi:Domain of unknown function (DUF4124)
MTKKIFMNKQITFLSIALSSFMLPALAHAEIYKVIDAQGHVTYTNVKVKGALKTDIEPADTSFGGDKPASTPAAKKPAAATKTATPDSFPKVDSGTQNQRDDKRKEVLKSELEAEKKALEDAKKAFAEGESNPEVFKTPVVTGPDGKKSGGNTLRNVPKFEAKMKALQAEVDAHQRNIELLNKEIGN